MEIREKIRKFIESNLVLLEDEIVVKDSDNIFEMGFVSSLFSMKLINYVEQEFQLEVATDEMEISNFSSIDRITEFIQKKKGM